MENFERCNLFKFHFNWDRLQRSILADEPPTPPSGHIYNWIESFSGGVISFVLFRFDVVRYTTYVTDNFFNITFKTFWDIILFLQTLLFNSNVLKYSVRPLDLCNSEISPEPATPYTYKIQVLFRVTLQIWLRVTSCTIKLWKPLDVT